MSSDVIYYDYSEAGAPSISGTAGAMIGVLDAILINGFNAKSVGALAVTSAVATATISAHGYKVGRKILIAGADEAGLNGIKLVVSAPDANTVTFAATGSADGTKTGTIVAKRAPLGWTKVAGDTTHGLYKRKDVTARSNLLRVVDTVPANQCLSSWAMVDTGTDMSTYTNPVPQTYNTDGGVVMKSIAANATANTWFAVGDGTSFYFFVQHGYGSCGYGFGDLKAYRTDDSTACFIICDAGFEVPYWVTNMNANLSTGVTAHSSWVAHSYDGTGVGQPLTLMPIGNTWGPGNADGAVFPSPYDNGAAVIENMPAFEGNYIRPIARGSFPGLAGCFSPVAQIAGIGAIVNGPSGSGKQYLALYAQCAGSYPATSTTSTLFDITGPWQ